jgi:hypothetical protein
MLRQKDIITTVRCAHVSQDDLRAARNMAAPVVEPEENILKKLNKNKS